jgi:anti-anti-sigma regulatory factor
MQPAGAPQAFGEGSLGAAATPAAAAELFDDGPAASGLRVWNSGGNHWHLAGEADLRTAPTLTAAMSAVAGAASSEVDGGLVLDCGELSFIDVAGLLAIARTALRLEAPVTVNGANDTLRRAWSMLDLHATAPNVEFGT